MKASSLVGAFAAALNVQMATAQDFPAKPVRLVAASAGGGSDFVARLIGQGITGPLGQPVIVDNRASTLVAAEVVSKASADGTSLLIGGNSLWIGSLLQKLPYEMNDFAAVTLVTRDINVLAVNPSLPVKSIKDLIALAKAKPGQLNYSSGPTGGSSHLATEMFRSMAGINMVRVPYKGTVAAVTATMNGDTQMVIYDVGVIAPHVKSGRLNGLAVTSATPSILLPNLPPIAATVPGYEATGYTGMFAPAKSPTGVIRRLNQEIVRVLNTQDAKEKLLNQGSEVVGSSPEELATVVKSELVRMGKVIKDAGIKVE